MDHEQTPINSRIARESGLRGGARRLVWTLEEKLVWQLGEALKAFSERARWPFERLLWWLQDRFAALGGGGRFAVAGGAALVVGALAVVLIALAGSGGSGEQTADRVAVTPAPAPAPAKAASPTRKPTPKREAAPTLHGAAPSFEREVPKQVHAAQEAEKETASSDATGSGEKEATTTSSSSAATAKISSRPSAQASSVASTETEVIPGRPAGPKAIAVARRFSQAFVLYETGGEESKVRKAFAKTTTPKLAKALLRRPPRLPADVKVPQAKVVTVVPGPSREGVYTLSVSLLRVGATSELRLEMEKLKNRGWRVTNVLG